MPSSRGCVARRWGCPAARRFPAIVWQCVSRRQAAAYSVRRQPAPVVRHIRDTAPETKCRLLSFRRPAFRPPPKVPPPAFRPTSAKRVRRRAPTAASPTAPLFAAAAPCLNRAPDSRSNTAAPYNCPAWPAVAQMPRFAVLFARPHRVCPTTPDARSAAAGCCRAAAPTRSTPPKSPPNAAAHSLACVRNG